MIFKEWKKNRIPVVRPNLIKVYNSAMGGVDLLDSAVGKYRTKIKGKKVVVVSFYKYTWHLDGSSLERLPCYQSRC